MLKYLLIFLWCWAALEATVTMTFVFEGSQTSYAQFRQWHGGLNDTLSFEFAVTNSDNALLLYSDNSDGREYLQIKLFRGFVMLR